MPSYLVYVNLEGAREPELEESVTATMAKFGFAKAFMTDDGTVISLPPWLYEGKSADDEVIVARRLRSMLHHALSRELFVLVMQAANCHFAHTVGSSLGIADIDPDLEA